MNQANPTVEAPAAINELDELIFRADQLNQLNALEQNGVIGRLMASRHAIANYHAPYVTQVKTFWGGSMEVDIRENVSSHIFALGIHEPDLSAFLMRALKPGQTFVDVGAHYGYFSLLAAHRVGEFGRVIAIEPCERTCWRLYRNLAQHKQAKYHRLAAWNREEVITLQDYGPLYSAFNSIDDRRIHEAAPPVRSNPFEVRAAALDDFFAEIGAVPHIIKIDAESAETQVLEGLARTLRDIRPLVTLEVGDFSHLLAKGLPSSKSVLEAVIKYDYVCFNSDVDGLRKHVLRESEGYEYSNIIAIPAEREHEFA